MVRAARRRTPAPAWRGAIDLILRERREDALRYLPEGRRTGRPWSQGEERRSSTTPPTLRLLPQARGSAHSLWCNPITGAVEAVPRHMENSQSAGPEDLQRAFRTGNRRLTPAGVAVTPERPRVDGSVGRGGEDDELGRLVDEVSGCETDLLHRAVRGGDEGVLHLHRFQDENRLTLADGLAGLDKH